MLRPCPGSSRQRHSHIPEKFFTRRYELTHKKPARELAIDQSALNSKEKNLEVTCSTATEFTKGSFWRATLSWILRSKGLGWKAPKIDVSILPPPPLPIIDISIIPPSPPPNNWYINSTPQIERGVPGSIPPRSFLEEPQVGRKQRQKNVFSETKLEGGSMCMI